MLTLNEVIQWFEFHTLAAYTLALYLISGMVSFCQYGLDKRAAKRNKQRIPEAQLLFVDLLGGWFGGLMAQKLFRHKTKKISYRVKFGCIVVLNIATASYLLGRYHFVLF